MREPVVVALGDESPPSEWMVGDSFFLSVGSPDRIVIFTVESIEPGPCVSASTDLMKRNPITNEIPEKYVIAYLDRIGNKRKNQSEADRIWAAVKEFSKI